MVDRTARNKMIDAIRAYMRRETTEEDYDEAICSIKSDDETVNILVEHLQLDYPSGSKFEPTKECWDYFNRVSLLLESNAERVAGKWEWRSIPFAVASSICLVVYFISMAHLGFDEGSYGLLMIPSAIVAALLLWTSHLINRRTKSNLEAHPSFDPFPSVASMLRLRRRMPMFVRVPYPAGTSRPKRSNWLVAIPRAIGLGSLAFLYLLVISPLMFLLLILPSRSHDVVLRDTQPPTQFETAT